MVNTTLWWSSEYVWTASKACGNSRLNKIALPGFSGHDRALGGGGFIFLGAGMGWVRGSVRSQSFGINVKVMSWRRWLVIASGRHYCLEGYRNIVTESVSKCRCVEEWADAAGISWQAQRVKRTRNLSSQWVNTPHQQKKKRRSSEKTMEVLPLSPMKMQKAWICWWWWWWWWWWWLAWFQASAVV